MLLDQTHTASAVWFFFAWFYRLGKEEFFYSSFKTYKFQKPASVFFLKFRGFQPRYFWKCKSYIKKEWSTIARGSNGLTNHIEHCILLYIISQFRIRYTKARLGKHVIPACAGAEIVFRLK